MTRVFIVGYESLIEKAKKVIKEVSFPPGVDINFLLAEQLVNKEIIMNKEDILICGERSEVRLKKMGINATVVPIKMNIHDFQKAIIAAYEHEPDKQVKVVVLGHKFIDIEYIRDYLKIQFEQHVFYNDEQIEDFIRELSNKDYKNVVGASFVCEIAKKYGINGISLFSEESVKDAIIYCIDLINVHQEKWERIEQLKAVTNFTYSAILSIDKDKKINVYNALAEQLLDTPACKALHQFIYKVIADKDLISIFTSNQPVINQIIKYKSKRLVITSIPITVNGEYRGTVSTFNDASSIQKQNRKSE